MTATHIEVLVTLVSGQILASKPQPAAPEDIEKAKEIIADLLGSSSGGYLSVDIDVGKTALVPLARIDFVTIIGPSGSSVPPEPESGTTPQPT